MALRGLAWLSYHARVPPANETTVSLAASFAVFADISSHRQARVCLLWYADGGSLT